MAVRHLEQQFWHFRYKCCMYRSRGLGYAAYIPPHFPPLKKHIGFQMRVVDNFNVVLRHVLISRNLQIHGICCASPLGINSPTNSAVAVFRTRQG